MRYEFELGRVNDCPCNICVTALIGKLRGMDQVQVGRLLSSAVAALRKQDVPRTDGLSADTFPVELYRVDLTVSWGDANRRNEQHFITLRSKLKEGQF